MMEAVQSAAEKVNNSPQLSLSVKDIFTLVFSAFPII
jgi:hypothetical protein